MIRKKIIRFLLFILPIFGYSQTYCFFNYGVKDGLAQSNISGIIQDSAGFYWLATDGGVSRFDGKNFVNFTTEDGLADNNVSTIFLDKNNHIWMGHANGSITTYDGQTFSQIKSRLLPKDKKIYGFYQDVAGSLYVSTETGGVLKIMNPARKTEEKLHAKVYSGRDGLSQYVFSTSEDKKGNLWFLTDIGVKILDKASRNFDFFRPQGMPLGQISCLFQDKKLNYFLIGTTSGVVCKYDPNKKSFESIINPKDFNAGSIGGIYTILEDSKGNVWASASNHGVYRYEKKSKKITLFSTANGLAGNKIKCIFEDKEGNILFGTAGEGLEVFSSEKFVSFTKHNGLIDNQVCSICKDKNGIYWFGTNEGISIYNPKETTGNAYKNIDVSNGLTTNNVRSIIEDKEGNLWIATWGGKVLKYDLQQQRIVIVPALMDIVHPLVSSLMVDSKNHLWIGTVEGIVIYDLANGSIKTLRTINGLSDNDISCLFEDSKGNVWIGTNKKGISVFDGKSFTIFNRDNGLNYNSITSIAEDKLNTIWLGTEGGGAFAYKNKTFKNYKIKDGLISDFITLITVDNTNNVWLGTNKGLTKYNSETKLFSSYIKNDGFTGIETKPRAVYKDNENNLWFGTVNGVFKYTPKLDIPVRTEPITRITQIKVNLDPIPLSSNIKLSYKENSLNFDFIGISLSNPEGVKYRVKLEGYDSDWKPMTNQNFEIYSNLPPDKYVFKLIACNSAGVCNSLPISIKIEITPPYWKTWWFYLIIFTIVAGSLFTYIKLRERKLLLEKKILEDKVNERTAEVVAQKHLIEEKHKEITDSINYAERIQRALLASKTLLDENLNSKTGNNSNYFILFKPKDVVSGDFYWATKLSNNNFALVTADSTGHGVPGAIMSILNIACLKEAVIQGINSPDLLLNETRKLVIENLKNDGSEEGGKDGMDASLLSFDFKKMEMYCSSANNPIWILRGSELIEIKADRMPIGKSDKDKIPFTLRTFKMQKDDVIYTLTDGFPDQFGGELGKKFKYKKLQEILLQIHAEPMATQKQKLSEIFDTWKGELEQVDDVCLIGVRI